MNSDTKRFVVAIVLSGVVLLGWQYIFPTPQKEIVTKNEVAIIEKEVASPKMIEEKKVEIVNTSLFSVKNYSSSVNDQSIAFNSNLSILDFKNSKSLHSFSETIGTTNAFNIYAYINGQYRPLELTINETSSNTFEGQSSDGLIFKAKLNDTGKFSIQLNSKDAIKYRFEFNSLKKRSDTNQIRQFVNYTNEADRIDVGNDDSGEGLYKWFGIDYNYHIFATVLKNKENAHFSTTEAGSMIIDFANPVNSFSFDFIFLKKNYDDLIALGDKLEMSVDFGFLGVIAVPILRVLQWCYGFIPNYGIAIIIVTLLMRLVMFPLQHKSAKSMKKMQNMQPQVKKIKEKFKDDPQRIQKETMELYKKSGTNPLGGCLPMLLQMPIFIAINRLLNSSVELVGAPFFGWITDLSVKDPYYIFPVLMAITMFFQTKMTPSASVDPNTSKIMMIMPLVFGFIMKDMPAGLILYFFVSNLFGITQQYLTNKLTD